MKKVLLLLVLMIFAIKTYAQDDAVLYKEKTFQTTSGKTFTIGTISSDAVIKTGSGNEVRVKVYANANAQRSIDFQIEETENGINVKEEAKEKDKNMNNIQVRYEITLPETYDLNSASASGNIEVSGLNGVVKVATASGDIKLSEINGETKVSSASGNIILTGRNGKINASTASGDINVDLSGDNKGTKLSSASGDIEFSFSSGFSADVTVSSLSGNIDVPSSISSTNRESKNSIRGTINGGGNDLKCSTVSGSVTIREK